MATQPSRKRRIVRRAVMALAGVVLATAGYISGALCVVFAQGAQRLPSYAYDIAAVVYQPIEWYERAELPGSSVLNALFSAAYEAGEKLRESNQRAEFPDGDFQIRTLRHFGLNRPTTEVPPPSIPAPLHTHQKV